MSGVTTVKGAARNRWPEILARLGIPSESLTDKHGPCPGCGGKDRFRLDDRDGRGTWICGGGGQTASGDGFALLMHVYGWPFAQALQAVAEVLGLEPGHGRIPEPLPDVPALLAHDPKAVERDAAVHRAAQITIPAPVVETPAPSRTQFMARDIWPRCERSDEVVAAHPYAKRKGITWAAGAGRARVSGRVVGQQADCLIVPIRDIATDQVVGVQCINPTGQKQTFGPVRGNAFICGNTLDRSGLWLIVEGWADAVSLVFRTYKGNACAFAAMGRAFDVLAERIVAHYAPDELRLLEDAA